MACHLMSTKNGNAADLIPKTIKFNSRYTRILIIAQIKNIKKLSIK